MPVYKFFISMLCTALFIEFAVSQSPPGPQPGWQVRLVGSGTVTANRSLIGTAGWYPPYECSSYHFEQLVPSAWWSIGSPAEFGFSFTDVLFESDNWYGAYSLGLNLECHIEAIASWNAGGLGEASPTRIYYRITSLVGGSNIGLSASNAIGNPSNSGPGDSVWSDGSRVFKKNVNDAETTLGNFSHHAQSAINSWLGNPTAAVSLKVEVINPAFISSNVESSYHKTASGQPALHERDSDLGLVVDKGLVWNLAELSWSGHAWLEGHQSAYDMAVFHWTKTVNAALPYIDELESDGPTFSRAFYGVHFADPDGTALNASTSFQLTANDVNDTSNVEFDNSYLIRWHLPYENWIETQPAEEDFDIIYPEECQPPLIPNNEGGIATVTKSAALWGVAKNSLALFGTVIRHPAAKLLAKFFEISVSEMNPAPEQRNPQFDPCWDSSYSRWEHPNGIGYGFPPPVPPGYTLDQWQYKFLMSPKFVVETRYHYTNSDFYGQHGYEGKRSKVVKRIFGMGAAGDYDFIGDGGGNGGGNPNG